MNIIYLHSHDTGRWVSPYGKAVDTPHLQRLAEQGVCFRQAFSVAPTCSASAAGLLTGTWAHCNGMTGLAHRGSQLRDTRQHLIHTLHGAGYSSALAGLQDVAADPESIGYHEILSEKANDYQRADAAIAYIRHQHDKPFFLDCGFHLTQRSEHDTDTVQWHNGSHSPLGEPRHCEVPAPLPDLPEVRRDIADFGEAVNRLDTLFGEILTAVDNAGLAADTLIICTTDHGIAFPFMKATLSDQGTGVMLFLRGPGCEGGKVVDGMVTHLDLFPTICSLAGIAAPDWLQGRSLLPLINGRAKRLHDAIFAEVNFHAAYEPKRSVRTERYKYIRRYQVLPHPVLPNVEDSPSKDALMARGWIRHKQEEEYLYDLAFDPNEANNRVADSACAGVLKDMRQRMATWMEDTDDPLTRGETGAWPGYRVNPVDDRSPTTPPIPFALDD
jgi:N-sulfoglucosamine sulfohydrolase